MRHIVAFLSLFTSVGTLFCCALPAAFVLLGFGATFAAITDFLPQIYWFGEHKSVVFFIGGFFLVASGFLHLKVQAPETCDVDGACNETKSWSIPLLYTSTVIYGVGAFFAFAAPFFF